MNPTELNSLQFEDVRNNAVNNTTENAATNAQASKSVGINVSAAYSYLSVLTGEQSKLSDEMKQAQSTLQRYVASLAYEPERAENANPTPAAKPLLDLVTRVVLRDINLQEQIANDLTSRIKIVKTGEAVDELKSYCDTLPKIFQESNDAGKALMRYLCEVVVNLSTADNISPATSRQLAQENIFAPDGVLTPKGEQTLTKLLSATMDFIVANQPDVLSSIGRESAMVISPSANKMQIAEFIQTAIEDMPDDNTYMNIFSKNSNNFEDETSAEIAKRVSELINKAASIAREGRLIDGKNSFDEAVSSRELAQRADNVQKQVESEQNSQQAELARRQETIDRLAKEISDRDEALERQEALKNNSRQTSTVSEKPLPSQNTTQQTQQNVPQQTMSADSVSKLKEALAEANIDTPKSYQNPNVLREAVAKTMVDSITGNRFTYPENEQMANKGYAGAQDENIDLIDEYEKFSLPVDNSAKPLADRPTSDEDVKINNVLSAAAARAKEGRLLDNNSRLDTVPNNAVSNNGNALPENVKRAADNVNFSNDNSNPVVNNNNTVNSNTVAQQPIDHTQQSSVQPQQTQPQQTQQQVVQPTEQQQYASSQEPEIESYEQRVQPQQSRIADDIARSLQNIDDEDIQNTRQNQPRVDQQVYNKVDDIDFELPREQLSNNTQQSSVQPQQSAVQVQQPIDQTYQSNVQNTQPSIQIQQPLVQPTEQQQYANSQEPVTESYEQRVQPQQPRIADDIARALQNIDDEDIQNTSQNQNNLQTQNRVQNQIQNQTQNQVQAPRDERVATNRFIAQELPIEQEDIDVGDNEAFLPKKDFVSKDSANVSQRELQRESTLQRETAPQRNFNISLDDVDEEPSTTNTTTTTTNSNRPVITNNMSNNISNNINERLFDTDLDIDADADADADADTEANVNAKNTNANNTNSANANNANVNNSNAYNADTDIDDVELSDRQTKEFSNDRQFAFRPEFTDALNNIDKEDGVKPSVDENDEDELMFSRARNSAAPFAAPIWEQETDLSVPNTTDNEDVDTNISLDKGSRDAFADIENMPPFVAPDINRQALEQPERNAVLTAEADLPDFKSEAGRLSNTSSENRNEQPKLNQAAMETIRRSLDATDTDDVLNNKPLVSVNREIANQNQRTNVEPNTEAVKRDAPKAEVLQNKFAVSDIPSFDDEIDSVDTNKVPEQKAEVKPEAQVKSAPHKQFNAVQSWASTLLDDDVDSDTDNLPKVSTTVDKNVQATSGEGTPKIINSSIAIDDTDFDANDDGLKVINNKAFEMSDEDALGDELNTLLQKAEEMMDEEPETFTDMFRKPSNQQNLNNDVDVDRVAVSSEDDDRVAVDSRNLDRGAIDKATLERVMKDNSPIDEYSTDSDVDTDTEELTSQKQTQKTNISAPDFSKFLADNDNEAVDNDFDDDSDLLRFSSNNKSERIPNDISTLQKMFAEVNAKDDAEDNATRNAESKNSASQTLASRNTIPNNTVIPRDVIASEIDDVDTNANNVDSRLQAQYTQPSSSTQQPQSTQQTISSQQTTSPSEESNVIGFNSFVDIDNDPDNATEAQSIFNRTPNTNSGTSDTREQIINNQANKELGNKELGNKEQVDVKSPLDRAFASKIMELDEVKPTSSANALSNTSTNEVKNGVNTPNASASTSVNTSERTSTNTSESIPSEGIDNQNSEDDSQKVSAETQQKPRGRQLFSFLNNKEPNKETIRETNVGSNAGTSKEPNTANNRENNNPEVQNASSKIQPSWSKGISGNTSSDGKDPSSAISQNNTERPVQNNGERPTQNTANTETTSQGRHGGTVTDSPTTTQNASAATTENQKVSVAPNTVSVDIDDDFSQDLDDSFSQKLGAALAQNLDEDLPNKPDTSSLQKFDTDGFSKALNGENQLAPKSTKSLADSLAEISEREKSAISNRYNVPSYGTDISKNDESAPTEVAEPKGMSRFINKFSKLTNLFNRNANKAADNGNTVRPDTPEQIEQNKFRKEASILSSHSNPNISNNVMTNDILESNSSHNVLNNTASTDVSSVANNTPSVDLKSVSMEDMIRSLSNIMNDGKITPEIKEMAGSIHQAMTNPLGDLVAVSEWLGLVNAPLTSTGSRARSMQQWALMLLSIRFRQLGKNIDKFTQTEPFRQMLKNMSLGENDKWPNNALNHTLQQVERMQQLSSDQEYGVPQFIPLPPSYEGGREGGLNVEHHRKEDGEMEWRLNFFFELPKLGPIQVRSSLQVPDVKLSIVTEKLEALQKVKETSNVLMNRLGDYGFKVAPLSARIGTIYPPAPRRTNAAASANRSSYSNKDGLSVNI